MWLQGFYTSCPRIEIHPIQCQWKYCDNKYYFHEGKQTKLKKCKRCKYSRYCSVRCQKLDWNRGLHKEICDLLCG